MAMALLAAATPTTNEMINMRADSQHTIKYAQCVLRAPRSVCFMYIKLQFNSIRHTVRPFAVHKRKLAIREWKYSMCVICNWTMFLHECLPFRTQTHSRERKTLDSSLQCWKHCIASMIAETHLNLLFRAPNAISQSDCKAGLRVSRSATLSIVPRAATESIRPLRTSIILLTIKLHARRRMHIAKEE